MANNVLIQASQIRELSKGELGPFSFKASSGKIFSGPPTVFAYGNEWDGIEDAILVVDDTATDFAILDRTGTGIYGTQTFKVSLKYDIGDIECGDEPQNFATIDFPTTSIGTHCIDKTGNIFFSPTYTGGDMPIFSNWVYPKQIPAGTYIGESGASYAYAGLSTRTYSFYVVAETNALTFYSSTLINGGSPFTITGQFSKTVNVSTNVYTGSIDIYWGTITLIVNGDFVNASMIFDNGLRGTENWITWDDKCWNGQPGRRPGVTTGIHSIIKTNSCEFTGGRGYPIYEASTDDNSNTSNHIMMSGTDAYSWGHVNQARRCGFNGGTYDIIEPYGYNKDDGGNGTIISIYANGVLRRSVDRGQTFSATTHNNSTWSSGVGTYARRINDVAYAGINSSGNKVWYGIGFTMTTTTSSLPNQQAFLMISEDDGQTWDMADVYMETDAYGNSKQADIYKVATKYGTTGTFHRLFRIHASLKYNYVFIEALGMKHDNNASRQSVLFKYHPSQTGSTNVQARVAPVAEFVREATGITPVTWDYANTFSASSYDSNLGTINNSGANEDNLGFAINPSTGFCIYMQQEMYMISWNYGINWTVDKDMFNNIATTQLHSVANVTLTYPEEFPSVVFYDGNFMIVTSVTYGETGSATSYRNYNNLPSSNDRIVDGLMQPIIKENSLITGDYIDDFSTYTSYGQVPSVTSTDFGPYNQIYGSGAPSSFGDGRAYIYMGYQTDLDPSYTNVYFMVYDFANDTVLNSGDLNSFAGGIMPNMRAPHGNTWYISPNANGPTITTGNVLYKTTDNFATGSVVFTGPKTNGYVTALCEYDGSSNNFIVTQTSSGYVNPGDALYYSTDGTTFSAVANLGDIGDGTSWNTATISKNCFIGSNCVMENGYIYFLDDTRQSTNGTLGRSFVIPVSQIADASTWVNYEITSALKNNNGSYNGVTRIVAIGDKAIIKYGTNEWQYTTDQGQSWTDITSITDTSGNVWSTTDLNSFYAQKNHNAGQFILAYQSAYNKANNVLGTWWQILWTTDFSTWNFAEWYQQDPNGDNNSSTPNLGGWTGDGSNGDIIATFRSSNSYTQKLRKVVVSDSQAESNPLLTNFIDTWEIIKEYEYIPAAEVTSPANGNGGFYTESYYIDQTSNAGVPRLLINHIFSVFAYPAPDSPTVANDPNPEIIAPVFTDVSSLTYSPATQQYRYRAQSEQPFSIVFTKANGSLMQFDGVFDIIVYSLSEPVLIEGFVNQDINVITNELVNRFQSEPSQYAANEARQVYYNREVYGFEANQITQGGTLQGVTWNPTSDDDYKSWVIYNYTYYLRHTNNRADVAKDSSNGALFREQITYENNFAIEIPAGYDMDNKGPGFNISEPYGQRMVLFPPQDNNSSNINPVMDIIGLKWYADLSGTQYADGYYWYDNLIGDTTNSIGGESRDGTEWDMTYGNVDDNTYIYIKNGFVTEIGNAKDLPNYDQC